VNWDHRSELEISCLVGPPIIGRSQVGKTSASVSNYRVNLGYYNNRATILRYNSLEISVSVISIILNDATNRDDAAALLLSLPASLTSIQ
jgi:hypothetical protein